MKIFCEIRERDIAPDIARILNSFFLKKKHVPFFIIFFFLRIKNGGVYGYIKPPDRAHTLKDVMPTNRLLLVMEIDPERIRQSEQTIPN